MIQFPSQYFMTSIKLTLVDVTMVKNNNRKSCPLVSLMTGGHYGLFVDIVTYLPDDLKTFNPFKDDLLQISILFNYPCG